MIAAGLVRGMTIVIHLSDKTAAFPSKSRLNASFLRPKPCFTGNLLSSWLVTEELPSLRQEVKERLQRYTRRR